MKKIIVAYWHIGKYPELGYEHQQEFNYSIDKQREITEDLVSKGFSVMLRPSSESLIIFIDKGRFGQR